jgi:hypothetical protein
VLACRPYVSLMDALIEVHNEEIHLRDAGLLQSGIVLAARSSVGRSSSTSLAAHGESGGLHCDHYGHDGHLEAFCYRKKKAQKAQAHHSSQGTGGTGSRGFERSSAGSETQEILKLLHCLAVSMSSGVAGSVTQLSTLTSSATASQSYALGPSSTPSPGTDPWYLDSGASFHMTPHSTHHSTLRPYYCIALFIPSIVPLFLLLNRARFVLTLFMSLMFLLFPI